MLLQFLACILLVVGGTCGGRTEFGALQPRDVERKPAAHDVILDINQKLFSESERSLLLEGDILRRRPISTFAVTDLRWPKVGGFVLVPYTLSPFYDNVMKNLVKEAFDVFKASTCVRFVERTKERDYISIVPLYGCYSNIGRIGGMQILSLGPECFLIGKGPTLHELMHVLGFWHEHSRVDREKYIDIIWKEILAGYKRNFCMYKTTNMMVNYDLLSILHYSRIAFTKDGADTIVPKPPYSQAHIGQRVGLSASDVLRVNKYYKCSQAGTPEGDDDVQIENNFPVFPESSCWNANSNEMPLVTSPVGATIPAATSLEETTGPAAAPLGGPTIPVTAFTSRVSVPPTRQEVPVLTASLLGRATTSGTTPITTIHVHASAKGSTTCAATSPEGTALHSTASPEAISIPAATFTVQTTTLTRGVSIPAAKDLGGAHVSTDLSLEVTTAGALKVTTKPTNVLGASSHTKVSEVSNPERLGSQRNASPSEKGTGKWVTESPKDHTTELKEQRSKESVTDPRATTGIQTNNPSNQGNKAQVTSLHETTGIQKNTPKLGTDHTRGIQRRAIGQGSAPGLPNTQYNNHLRDLQASGIWEFNIPVIRKHRSLEDMVTRNQKFVGHQSLLRDLNRQPVSESPTFRNPGIKLLKVLGSRQTKRRHSQLREMDSDEFANGRETLWDGSLGHVKKQRPPCSSPSWNIEQQSSMWFKIVTSLREDPMVSPCINCLTAPPGSTSLSISKSGIIRSGLADPASTRSTGTLRTVPSALSSLRFRIGGLVSRMDEPSSTGIHTPWRAEHPPLERLVSAPSAPLSHVFCDFEKGLCGWKVCNAGYSRWTYMKDNWIFGGPSSYRHEPRVSDGPPAGRCVSLKPSSSDCVTAQQAALISPIMKGPRCISFWYRLQGSIRGMIRMHVQFVESPGTWHMHWMTQGQQGTCWIYTEVALLEMEDEAVFQVVLEGIVGPAPDSEITIDNLRLMQHRCAEAENGLDDKTKTGP